MSQTRSSSTTARTCPAQANELASRALRVACGSNSLESLKSAIQSGSSSRMSLAELVAGSPPCDADWTSSAMKAYRSRLAHAIAEPPTSADECSSLPSELWPTPTASRYGSTNNGCPGDGRGQYATRGKPSLDSLVKRWPTPTTSDSKHSRRHGYMDKGNSGTTLLDAALIFDGSGPQDPRTSKDGRATLPAVVLNPQFCEALLGMPVGFTAVGSTQSATQSARNRRR